MTGTLAREAWNAEGHGRHPRRRLRRGRSAGDAREESAAVRRGKRCSGAAGHGCPCDALPPHPRPGRVARTAWPEEPRSRGRWRRPWRSARARASSGGPAGTTLCASTSRRWAA